MTRCAFIASGGGIKAYAFHLGVLKALESSGFRLTKWNDPPDRMANPSSDSLDIGTYIGSSAGACASCAAIFFDNLEEAEGVLGLNDTAVPKLDKKVLIKRPKMWPVWRIPGFSHASGVEKFLCQIIRENDFRTITPDLFVVATQLNGARKVIFGPRDSGASGDYNPTVAYYNDVAISESIAASMSVPVFFQPYEILNRQSGESIEYIDGEVRETLSAHIARDVEMDLVIVSNTWIPYYYRKQFGSIAKHGLIAVFSQAITQMMEQKILRFRDEIDRQAMTLDYIRMKGKNLGLADDAIDELVKGAALTLQYHPLAEIRVDPDPADTRFNLMSSWSLDAENLRYVISRGYERAMEALEQHFK